MKASLNRLFKRIGRRGYFFGFYGFLVLLIGVVMVMDPPGPAAQANAIVLTTIAPIECYAYAWIAIGVICMMAAFWKRLECAGSALLAALGSFVAIGYLVVGVLASLGYVHGTSRPLLGAAFYAGLAGSLLIISGWKES